MHMKMEAKPGVKWNPWRIKNFQLASGQDGDIGRHTVPPRTIKEGQQFKNKKQPELTENQTVWKSNNQKEKK